MWVSAGVEIVLNMVGKYSGVSVDGLYNPFAPLSLPRRHPHYHQRKKSDEVTAFYFELYPLRTPYRTFRTFLSPRQGVEPCSSA